MKLFIRSFLSLIVGLGLAGCAHTNPGPQMAGLTKFSPSLHVKSQWSRDVGDIGKHQYVKLTPVIAGNQIYAASYSGYITALDLSSGRKFWQINTGYPLTSGLGAGAGNIFVGTGKGQVLALNQANGSNVWSAPVSNEVLAAPVVTKDYVLVKSVDDHVYVLNNQNGQVNWSYDEQTPELILRAGSSPQVAGNNIVVGFADGQLGVFNRDNGLMVWKRPIAQPTGASLVDRMVDIDDNLVIIGNVIYVATYQGIVAAVNLQTGQILWQHDISSYTGLTNDGQNLYVTDADSHVWAFDQQTGKVVWQQNNLFGRGITAPTMMSGAVVVADGQGYVHWLSTVDGHFLARASTDDSGIIATPVVNNNSVYIYTNAGRLIKFNVN